MTEKKPLTDEEIAHFRQKLMACRREILGDVRDLRGEVREEGEPGRPAASPANAPTHPADLASDEQSEHQSLQLAEHEREMLAQIDEALERIRSGGYGLCQADRGPISRERLEAKPWARFCIEHAPA
jgi:RNA polymerase-binding protein DksA